MFSFSLFFSCHTPPHLFFLVTHLPTSLPAAPPRPGRSWEEVRAEDADGVLDSELWLSLLGEPSQPPLCLPGLGFVTVRARGPMFSQEGRSLEERPVGPEHGGDGSRGHKELHSLAEPSVSGLRRRPAQAHQAAGLWKVLRGHQGRPVSLRL